MAIQFASNKDIESILAIYNQSIPLKMATADTELASLEKMKEWFESHPKNQYPIFVYKLKGQVIAYNSLSPYRNGRKALSTVLETSYFVDKDFQKKGIASSLMSHAITWCKENRVETLITFILAHNNPSIRVMHKFGFEKWGILPQIAKFDSKTFDHIIFGKRIT